MSFKIVEKVYGEHLYRFLKNNRYLIDEYYRDIVNKDKFLKNEVRKYEEGDFEIVKYFLKDNKIEGLYSLKKLDWDSRLFKKNIWKMKLILNTNISHYISRLKSDFIEECNKHDIQHVSCHVKSKDYISAQTLEKIGFKITDTMIRFGINLDTYKRNNNKDDSTSIVIRQYEKEDYNKVLNLVKETFKNYPNRFRNDSSFEREKCDEFYLEWARNSMKGFADLIIVAEHNNDIVGFATAKYKKPFNNGLIVAEGQLAGVLESCRGQGLNTRMLKERLNITSKYADFYEVGTQIYNYGSQRTFYKCGLKPMDSYFSFHISF